MPSLLAAASRADVGAQHWRRGAALKAATVYARLGWLVMPLHDVASGVCSCHKGAACTSAGKHPRLNDWVTAASCDPAVIAGWISRYPKANIGVATGHSFFVLDIDPDNGGPETLAALIAEHGELPATAQARTGSGGSHYLFNHVAGVTNSAGKLGRGLDTRGEGGQIVVAPSVSAKGAYRWVHAPWKVPIADAPTWLIEALQRKPPAPVVEQHARGSFPPASPEVLQAAADALDQHGPAMQGDGGDAHTFIAAAMLVHDFALTDEEVWPLLYEWNLSCVPPWSDVDLAAKMRGGGKYATRAYGCRRSMDAVETAKKAISDWQAAGASEPAMFAMLDRVRELAALSGDPAKRAVIERELASATGLGARALALPAPETHAEVKIPSGTIEVTTLLHEVADKSIDAIAPHVFQRNGVLCEVVKTERTFIYDLETARIQDLMSRASKFVRVDDKGTVTQAAPERVAALLYSRRTHPKVRVLEAVTTAPVFLADGSILHTRGYNAQSRVFLEPSVAVDVPDEPTREDAYAAASLFADLLRDFNFASPADFSSWLAALLSPLVKAATGNAPSPLVCISASSAGSGKTLLAEVISRVVTGNSVENRPYNPRDPAEWGKRLTAFVKAASPVSVFDNANGAFGDEGLDRLITSSTWSDRILGASDAPPLPNVTTWLATGNNIEPIGDTVRRCLMVRIEVKTERPQERTGFKYHPLDEYAGEHRSELLSAALTILRAFHCAGRPAQRLPSWGSFTAWSALVRGALVWTGLADPFETQRRASMDLNEPENQAHDFWIEVVEHSDGLAASIVKMANQMDAQTVLGARDSITAFTLKKFIGKFVDKPRAGRRIRREIDGKRNQTLYHVEMI